MFKYFLPLFALALFICSNSGCKQPEVTIPQNVGAGPSPADLQGVGEVSSGQNTGQAPMAREISAPMEPSMD